jgi:amidase
VSGGLAEALRIGRLDAHGQAALVRSGKLSAVELIEAAIVRIEWLDGAVNAVSHRAFEAARERARAPGGGAMAGVPYLIKDSLPYPGMPARAGSRSRGDAPPAQAFPFIRRFDAEGLIPVGKSSMAELGMLVSNEPLLYGPTNNPWDLARSPGGSSGGAAAAVAAGLVPLAHGSDAAGSIRVPAAVCGLVGLKPSRGGNLRARGAHWLDDMLCGDGMLTRSVRDAAWAFAVASPTPAAVVTRPPERRLRIGLVLEGLDGGPPHPDVAGAILKAAELCADLGHAVDTIARPPGHADILHSLLRVLWPFLGLEAVEHAQAAHPGRPLDELLEPWALGLAGRAAGVTPGGLERALEVLAAAPEADQALLADFDLILSPTVAEPAVRTGELAPDVPFDRLMARFIAFAPYTPLQNMAGSPAISLPLFTTASGLPVGAMFAGRRGGEDLLLSLALELEAAAPWADRWPALNEAAASADPEAGRP